MSQFFESKKETTGSQAGSTRATFDDPRAQGLINSITGQQGQNLQSTEQAKYLQQQGIASLLGGLGKEASQVDASGQLDAIRRASDSRTGLDVANVRSQFYNKPTGRNDIAVADTVARNAAARDAALYQTEMGAQEFNANAQNQQRILQQSLGSTLAGYQDANQVFGIQNQQNQNQNALQLLSLMRGEDTTGSSTSTTRARAPGSQIAGQAIGAIASGIAMCWVARAVYGSENATWLVFREWLLTEAPTWLRSLYLRHGEEFAEKVKKDEKLRLRVKRKMDSILLDRFKIIRN